MVAVMEHHMNVLLISAGCLVLLVVAFFLLFVRLTSRRRMNSYAADLEELFLPARYRAMERVLDEADQNFLCSHPRCDARMEKSFRKTRIGIFRGYLRQLDADFSRICKAITLLMVTSKIDRPDLAGLLLKQKFFFAFGLLSLEFKLIFFGLGWSKVDGRNLIQSLDTMRACLESFAAIAQPAAA